MMTGRAVARGSDRGLRGLHGVLLGPKIMRPLFILASKVGRMQSLAGKREGY